MSTVNYTRKKVNSNLKLEEQKKILENHGAKPNPDYEIIDKTVTFEEVIKKNNIDTIITLSR